MREAWCPRWQLVVSPVFLLSIVVLVVNDHVLKAAAPGLVTGKLSDVAGVVMVAILATAVLGRAGPAFVAVAIGFSALKTVPVVAVWAAPVLGGVTLTDPSDLVALLVLVPLWRWIRSAPAVRPGDPVRLLPFQIVAVSAAVLATTATSCDPGGVAGIGAIDGLLYAEASGVVFTSTDRVNWSETDRSAFDGQILEATRPMARGCDDDGACVEIVHFPEPGARLGIDRTEGDVRTRLLTLTLDDVAGVDGVVGSDCGLGVGAGVYVPRSSSFDGVLVAMGESGALLLNGDQTWSWVAIGDHGLRTDAGADVAAGLRIASSVAGDPWDGAPRTLAAIVLLFLGPALAFAVIPIRAAAVRNHREPALAVAICVTLATVLGAFGLAMVVVGSLADSAFTIVMSATVLVSIGVLGVATLYLWHRRSRRPLPPPAAPARVGATAEPDGSGP